MLIDSLKLVVGVLSHVLNDSHSLPLCAIRLSAAESCSNLMSEIDVITLPHPIPGQYCRIVILVANLNFKVQKYFSVVSGLREVLLYWKTPRNLQKTWTRDGGMKLLFERTP